MVWLVLLFNLSKLNATNLPSDIACKSAVETEIEREGAKDWFRVPDPSPGARAYRSPSARFGTWNELHHYPDRTRYMRISEQRVDTFVWNKNCEVTKTSGKWLGRTNFGAKENLFRDEDLSALIKDGSGVIYVWTPGMTYSIQKLKSFESIAAKKSLKFTAVQAERLFSVELMMRTVSGHYPQTWVFKNGKLTIAPLLGVFENELLERRLDERLKDIQ